MTEKRCETCNRWRPLGWIDGYGVCSQIYSQWTFDRIRGSQQSCESWEKKSLTQIAKDHGVERIKPNNDVIDVLTGKRIAQEVKE